MGAGVRVGMTGWEEEGVGGGGGMNDKGGLVSACPPSVAMVRLSIKIILFPV